MKTFLFVVLLALCAGAASAETIPLMSMRGTSLGIGPNYEWYRSGGDQDVVPKFPHQFTIGLYGAKTLFDGDPQTQSGIGSTAIVGSFSYGLDNKDLRYTLGVRWRIWNRQ